MKTVYLARHGETEWNRAGRLQGAKDSPLTQRGVAQAHAMAEFFSTRHTEAIYCSPLLRAHRTALIIGERINKTPLLIPSFIETFHGLFEGKTKEETMQEYPAFWKERERTPHDKLTIRYPGEGESYLDVYNRSTPELDKILSLPLQTTLLVAHEGVNRMLRGYLLGLSLETMINLRQPNEVIVEISFVDKKEVVHRVHTLDDK